MKLERYLTVGHRLNVIWHKSSYSSLLLDIGRDYLEIGVIQKLGRKIYLPLDATIKVGFGVPERGYFSFSSRVLQELTEPTPALRIAYPTVIERVQKRTHYRLGILLPISFRLLNNLKSHASFISHEGSTVDISGGGMQFISQYSLRPGDRLEVDFPIDAGLPYGLDAIILRVSDEFDGTYRASVQLKDIERQQEEAIVRYVFQEQVRRRRLQQ